MNLTNYTEGAYKKAFLQGIERLKALKPAEVVGQSLSKYDEGRNCFIINSFGHEVEIFYDGTVRFADTGMPLPFDWALILLNYLSSARAIPPAHEPVSYRDLPLGNVFYPNIRTYVLQELAQFYDRCDKGILSRVLTGLGFTAARAKADLAVEGSFAPRVPVRVLFWEGEDEIPSSCQLLFDRTAAEQMHIEDLAALCGVIKHLIITKYEEETKSS